MLTVEPFDGFFSDSHFQEFRERLKELLQSDSLLEVLDDGMALVDRDLKVTWANQAFQKINGNYQSNQGFYESLNSPEILGPDYCPFHTAMTGRSVLTRLHSKDKVFYDLRIIPVQDGNGMVHQMISILRDVTQEVQRQQKLDALHQAGKELAALPTEQLAEMSTEERVELLKINIRRLTHDLLKYSVIEIRLLDKTSGKLVPLLEEGMTPDASSRVLFASTEGNGVTGFVAATRESYLCHDTNNDPLYLEGSVGARSSMTVAICVGDDVLGTFNVESPQPNSFRHQDLQFLEIFSREIAMALHTLDLLSAEKRSTANQFVDAFRKEVSLPVDDILHLGTAMLDRWIGHDPEMELQLRQILHEARHVKQLIQKIGEDLTPIPTDIPQDSKANLLKNFRVLVIDHDERVRRSAHLLLGRFGCIVETAKDGKEALIMARMANYDAVLTDIRLPDMGGYEIYQKLRTAQPNAQVILMTAFGYDPSHSIVKARQDGLKHVLYKPFRIEQMLAALSENSKSKMI